LLVFPTALFSEREYLLTSSSKSFVFSAVVTLKEDNRLRVSEDWVMRRIFGSKRDGVTGG
jgi:hypothetical protein